MMLRDTSIVATTSFPPPLPGSDAADEPTWQTVQAPESPAWRPTPASGQGSPGRHREPLMSGTAVRVLASSRAAVPPEIKVCRWRHKLDQMSGSTSTCTPDPRCWCPCCRRRNRRCGWDWAAMHTGEQSWTEPCSGAGSASPSRRMTIVARNLRQVGRAGGSLLAAPPPAQQPRRQILADFARRSPQTWADPSTGGS